MVLRQEAQQLSKNLPSSHISLLLLCLSGMGEGPVLCIESLILDSRKREVMFSFESWNASLTNFRVGLHFFWNPE